MVVLKKSGLVVFDSDVGAANAAHAVKAGLVEEAKTHNVTVEWVIPEVCAPTQCTNAHVESFSLGQE